MSFKIESIHLNGIIVIVPDKYEDERGYFMETYREDEFKWHGISDRFVQDNQSSSKAGVVRGLHFQWDPPMGKLMRVIKGEAFLVAVDIRKGSPTLGRGFAVVSSDDNKRQVWAPAGFARGFGALTDCIVQYKCTGLYNKECEGGILWNDPEIGIVWPCACAHIPNLSEKDTKLPTLKEWLETPESNNFRY